MNLVNKESKFKEKEWTIFFLFFLVGRGGGERVRERGDAYVIFLKDPNSKKKIAKNLKYFCCVFFFLLLGGRGSRVSEYSLQRVQI